VQSERASIYLNDCYELTQDHFSSVFLCRGFSRTFRVINVGVHDFGQEEHFVPQQLACLREREREVEKERTDRQREIGWLEDVKREERGKR
jgi:hypothetical protein